MVVVVDVAVVVNTEASASFGGILSRFGGDVLFRTESLPLV